MWSAAENDTGGFAPYDAYKFHVSCHALDGRDNARHVQDGGGGGGVQRSAEDGHALRHPAFCDQQHRRAQVRGVLQARGHGGARTVCQAINENSLLDEFPVHPCLRVFSAAYTRGFWGGFRRRSLSVAASGGGSVHRRCIRLGGPPVEHDWRAEGPAEYHVRRDRNKHSIEYHLNPGLWNKRSGFRELDLHGLP